MTIEENQYPLQTRLFLLFFTLLSITACETQFTSAVISSSELNVAESDYAAHWVTPKLILLPSNKNVHLLNLQNGVLERAELQITDMPLWIGKQFPHLAHLYAYEVSLSTGSIKEWLKHEVIVVETATDGKLVKKSYVQTGHVIDALYTQGNNDADEEMALGAYSKNNAIEFKLWAPTAQSVTLLGFKDGAPLNQPFAQMPMQERTNTGIWHLSTTQMALYDYYQYKITVYHPQTHQVETLIVTDPYSLSLSTNGTHSQVVDLSAKETKPHHWDNHSSPTLNAPEDQVLYETHIRDFSAADWSMANQHNRGKYLAFTEKDSNALKHIKALKKAGLNTIHLLPAFDFGSVNEEVNQVVDLNDRVATVCDKYAIDSLCQREGTDKTSIKALLTQLNGDTSSAQQIVSDLRALDNYNWGYDPVHYSVPEGSYATDPMGITRIIEFRAMVKQLHALGFRVVMDVVYNHTHQYGLKDHSVLDKVVPGYYHRLHPVTGEVEQSTCFSCGNTATERTMMAKLMRDSLVVWAKHYKIDGFRFDLMGHQPKEVMLETRDAIRNIDSDTYFYGEGWNFGEVANNRRFVQASQLELGGSEIGTFSDRLRDAIRGAGNNTRDTQGLGNGLLTMPNERQENGHINAEYQLAMNQTRIGLAGNLANFALGDVIGSAIPYGSQNTGYAFDPADTINYVSKHDNQTLWDNNQYRLPFNTTIEHRVRLHNLSLSYVLYAQGIPFIHMGSELLRSKSFLRDSYDYGDWFNAVDFAQHSNNYLAGLPPADKDLNNWPLITEVRAGHSGRDLAMPQHIHFASEVFKNLLAVRASTQLLRLESEHAIMQKVRFLNLNGENHQKGVIAMEIDDNQGARVDHKYKKVFVIFNNNPHDVWFDYKNDLTAFELHEVLANGTDDSVKRSHARDKKVFVPALTAAVFVVRR